LTQKSDSKFSSVFDHVSYTEPDWKTTPQALLDAARRWRPMSSRTVERFDVDAFQNAHGLEGRASSRPSSVAPREILQTMNKATFRNGPSAFPWDGAGFVLDRIGGAIRGGRPVEVLLPSFAGRPHNAAAHRRVAPDLGELYALQLLKNISDAVKQIYPPGVLFTLILDGRAYRPFYGYSDDEARPYSANLANQIDLLGARGQVQLVDMFDLMTARAAELDNIDERVRSEVSAVWQDPAFKHRADLVRALRQGTETTAISAAFIELYKSGRVSSVDAQKLFVEASEIVNERAHHTAFEYAVLLTKLKRLDVLGRAFPHALRGTVHPKPGQYSPRIKDTETIISPWHGVAIEKMDGRIVTEYEAVVYESFERYEAIYVRGDEAPFYYWEIAAATGSN
jgi:pyoverdine/dityrosine biosynthesis protein Dit1